MLKERGGIIGAKEITPLGWCKWNAILHIFGQWLCVNSISKNALEQQNALYWFYCEILKKT